MKGGIVDMYSGEQEAQMITRVVIAGSVFILKIAGKETIHIAKFLSAVADGQLSTSGEIKLKTLLKSGQPLKVFSLKGDNNFITFSRGANEYGIVYSVVRRTDEEVDNQLYDIMVKQSDASKINRVIEKYGLLQLSDSDGTAVITDESVENGNGDALETKGMPIEDVRSLLAKMLERESGQSESENFTGVSESVNLSDTKSEYINNEDLAEMYKRFPGTNPEDRPSIRQEIKRLTEGTLPDNDATPNNGILTHMMLNEDSDGEDILKYSVGFLDSADNNLHGIINEQTGGEITDEHTI